MFNAGGVADRPGFDNTFKLNIVTREFGFNKILKTLYYCLRMYE